MMSFLTGLVTRITWSWCPPSACDSGWDTSDEPACYTQPERERETSPKMMAAIAEIFIDRCVPRGQEIAESGSRWDFELDQGAGSRSLMIVGNVYCSQTVLRRE